MLEEHHDHHVIRNVLVLSLVCSLWMRLPLGPVLQKHLCPVDISTYFLGVWFDALQLKTRALGILLKVLVTKGMRASLWRNGQVLAGKL